MKNDLAEIFLTSRIKMPIGIIFAQNYKVSQRSY